MRVSHRKISAVSRRTFLAATAAVTLAPQAALAAPDGATVARGKAALAALIAQAKKEPDVVDAHPTLSHLPFAPKANQLFNAHFGLNKTIKMSEGVDDTFTAQMIETLKVGGTPSQIFYNTIASNMPIFVDGGYVEPIRDWAALLAAVNPRVASGAVAATTISPNPTSGYAFAYSNRLKGVGFRTAAPRPDLPRTYEQMADPKFAGHYAIEPWTSHWEALGYNYYPNRLDQYLKMLNTIGKGAYVVSRSHQLIPRMALGEFNYMTLNDEVVAKFLAENPGSPVDYYFMNDMVPIETSTLFIPKKSAAPATATLFLLYFTHPDVQALRAEDSPNILYGEKPFDAVMRARLKGKHIWDWTMNASTLAYLKWINGDEGKVFRSKVLQAIHQRT